MKRSTKHILLSVLLVGMLLVAAACGQGQTGDNGEVEGKEDWPRGLTIGTGSIGGIYHAWAGGWANILQGPIGIPMSIEVTAGGVDNVRLVESGDVDIGLAADGIVYAGLKGTEWANGEVHSNVRTMFVMYPGYFQLHALTETGIKSIHDLEGKNFAPGPAGSSADTYWRSVLNFFGINANIMNMGYADATDQMRDGLIHVIGLAPTGVPHPSTAEICTTHDVTVFGIEKEDIEKLQREFPYMQLGQIPAGVYEGHDEDADTVMLWNVFVVHKDLPESLVYELVKLTFENHEALVSAHSSARDTLAENVKYLTVPLHKGAYKYYVEQGIEVPQQAKPID